MTIDPLLLGFLIGLALVGVWHTVLELVELFRSLDRMEREALRIRRDAQAALKAE